jgi:DNA repair protein RadC
MHGVMNDTGPRDPMAGRQTIRRPARRAAGVVVFHAPPGGDSTPFAEDLAFTRRMAAAATLAGVDLMGHLVPGATGLWVFQARGCR